MKNTDFSVELNNSEAALNNQNMRMDFMGKSDGSNSRGISDNLSIHDNESKSDDVSMHDGSSVMGNGQNIASLKSDKDRS